MTDVQEIVDIESQIAELEKRRNELIAEGGDSAKSALVAARTAEIFEQFPQVQSVAWVQYVPYFNDGDPCTWSIIGPGINVTSADPDEDEDEDESITERIDMWSFEYALVRNADSDDEYYVSQRARYPGFDKDSAKALIEALKPIEEWLERSESYLNDWFGHAVVVVERGGVVKYSEYYHD